MGQPLEGVRVIELGHVMAGPVCGRMLADLGADVVKVEPPTGDPSRGFGTGGSGVPTAAAFDMLNRNKRGVVVDLRQEEGVRVVRRLLNRADVVLENFRPGVMEKLGLGYDTLREENPRLIYCQISGFGTKGPMAQLGGFDLVAQGLTGLLSITGEGPGRPPTKSGAPVTDITAGILGALGVLAALQARERSGMGQKVETSLYAAGVFQTLWHSAITLETGASPGPLGSAHPLTAPYEAFETADGWITVGGSSEAAWRRLVKVLDLPELTQDPRFSNNAARMAHVDELRAALVPRFRDDHSAAWLGKLQEAGVPAGPVSTIAEMLAHPQAQAVGMVTSFEEGGGQTLGLPIALSATPAVKPTQAPLLGQNSEEVLLEFGFEVQDIESLKRLKIVS